MEDNYIKPIGETLQDKISWLQKELFKEKERNENSIPIPLIEKKIEELKAKDNDNFTDREKLKRLFAIEILQELLDERSRDK